MRRCLPTPTLFREYQLITRILITGKNGQLGYELARIFSHIADVEVHALDRTQLDLTRPEQIRAVIRDIKPALIINAAAYTAVDNAERDAVLAMQVNGIAPGILAEEANRCGAALVHYSTDYVFAGDGTTPYRETDAVDPQNVYGKTKLAGELAVSSIAARYLILRAAWLYSNRRHNFLLTMLRLACERDELKVVNDQLGCPTWVRDVAEATQKMLSFADGNATLNIASGIHHVAAAGVTSWHGFADAIITQTNDPARRVKRVEAISSEAYKAPAKRPAYSVLSHDKLASAGIVMRDWQTQLRDCIAERQSLAPETIAASAPNPIQVFMPTFRVEECLAEIRECLEKGWTGLGYKTVAFEEAWKAYTGLPHAHFLSSATVGLHLAVEVLKRKHGWADGDEIITTPLTFVSDSHTILYANMKPVFADVDASLCLDPLDVAKKITPKTRAVMFVGMGGNAGQYAAVLALCRSRGLAMILDAAHMSGTKVGVEKRHVGFDADVTVFSYQAVKNLPTADAGMISFRDAADDEVARKLTWLGINKDTYARTASQGNYKWKYDVEYVGYKYHGNSIMAAIALVQLKYLDQDNIRRREIAARYRAGFAAHANVRMIPIDADCESSTHLCQIRVSNRDDLMMKLNQVQIYPGVHYLDNTLYRMFTYADGTCPNARVASNEIISLPIHLRMTDADVDRVIAEVIKNAA
jgi:dTDP-4-dehydrorhamnose reductase